MGKTYGSLLYGEGYYGGAAAPPPSWFRAQVGEFIQGAGRLMWAGSTITYPNTIADIVNISTFDPMAGWYDAGATKHGIAISNVIEGEEEFESDIANTMIDSRPLGWGYSVSTALAQVDLASMQLAWETGAKATLGGYDLEGVGEPTEYKRRRLAVLFRKENGIRAHVFANAQHSPQESELLFNKKGEQQALAVRFKAFADMSRANQETFGTIFDIDLTTGKGAGTPLILLLLGSDLG